MNSRYRNNRHKIDKPERQAISHQYRMVKEKDLPLAIQIWQTNRTK